MFQDKGQIFILEEFIEGNSLQAILRERKGLPLPFDEAIVYMKGLCAALYYAHTNNVVHCDVKPGNVMVNRQGKIFLTDFGIARFIGATTTTTIGIAGTPAYMAPEQIVGKGISPLTDVYALGVILFEMLTGQRPFRGTEPDSEAGGDTPSDRIRYAHLRLPPPDPRQINPNLSAVLSQMVLRALAKNPSERFRNAGEFFAALCRAAQKQPNQVSDETTVIGEYVETPSVLIQKKSKRNDINPRANKFNTRRKAVLGWMIPIIFLIVVLVVWFFYRPSYYDVVITETVSPVTQVAVTEAPVATESPTTVTEVPVATEVPTITQSQNSWNQGKIVYLSPQNQEEHGIYLLNMENGVGQAELILPASSGNQYYAPLLSPDGLRVAFYISGQGLWVLENLIIDQPRILSACTRPSWSGDGSKIICRQGQSLQIINSQSGNELKTLPIDGDLPSWSPSANEIAFVQRDGERTSIWRVDVDSGEQILLAGNGNENYAPSWSPDGQWLAYQSNLNSANSQVWIMDRNGNNARQITTQGNWSRAPAWSPDGKWLAFVSDAEGSIGADYGEAFLISLTTDELHKLTATGGSVYDWRVSWSR